MLNVLNMLWQQGCSLLRSLMNAVKVRVRRLAVHDASVLVHCNDANWLLHHHKSPVLVDPCQCRYWKVAVAILEEECPQQLLHLTRKSIEQSNKDL